MTVVKQKAVTSGTHAGNLERYINGKDAVLRDGWNLSLSGDWFREMEDVRFVAGHDVPSRVGAKNTLMFHQVLAFLPEEADINGGPMTPERCMEYAREYVRRRYPNQQVAFALHEEVSPGDGTHRYACHLAINRTDLVTGKRLAEGYGKNAKIARANAVRDMDREWGLKEVVEGERNSEIHERQLYGAAKEIVADGRKSYKDNLRAWCEHLAKGAKSLPEFLAGLEDAGFVVSIKDNGRLYVSDPDRLVAPEGVRQETGQAGPVSYWFDISKLGARFNLGNLSEAFKDNGLRFSLSAALRKEAAAEAARQEAVSAYKRRIKAAFADYKAGIIEAKGTPYEDLPVFKVPKRPEGIREDQEVLRIAADYRNRARKLMYVYGDMGSYGAFGVDEPVRQGESEEPGMAPARSKER